MAQRLKPLARPFYENEPLGALDPDSPGQQEQTAFDDQVVTELKNWRLPDQALKRLTIFLGGENGSANLDDSDEREQSEAAARPAPRRSILSAVALGLVLTACIIGFVIHEQSNSFAGSDRLIGLLDGADRLTGDEFEPVEVKAKDLGDYFFLKHGLDRFTVPNEFGNIKTIGCRVFKDENAQIAQIMAVGEKELLFYLFNQAELGVNLRRGKWIIVDGEHWVGGATANNGIGFMVAFRGNHQQMQEYLGRVAQ